jgi:hypothetical protein
MPVAPREPTEPSDPYKDPKTKQWVEGIPWGKDARRGPWSADGRFQWLVPPGALAPDKDERTTDQRIMAIADISGKAGQDRVAGLPEPRGLKDKPLKATWTPDGWKLETKPTRGDEAAKQAHWWASAMEQSYPQLRRLRTVHAPTGREVGEALGDDRPLALRPDMRADESQARSRYAGIDKNALGDAAQAALPEFAGRLSALPEFAQTDPEDFDEFTIANGNRQGHLDWRSGQLGLECKGYAWIGLAPGITPEQQGVKTSPKDTALKHRMTKLEECWARRRNGKPLEPALCVQLVDLHDGVTHTFVLRYPGRWNPDKPGQWQPGRMQGGRFVPSTSPQAFSGQRVPTEMQEMLIAGELKPGTNRGMNADPEQTLGGWTYVGSLPLRYNPHVMPSERLGDIGVVPGTRLEPTLATKIVTAPGRTRRRGGAFAPERATDIEPEGERTVPLPRGAARRKSAAGRRPSRRDEVVAVARKHPSWTQAQIARSVGGMAAASVQKYLRAHHAETGEDLRPGQGARGDLRRGRRKPRGS